MKFRVFILILLLGVILGGSLTYYFTKTEKPKEEFEISHNMIVEKIESMGKLEVVKYSIQNIVEYKKVRQWLPNAKTALIISGEVIGCIDFTKINLDNIYTSNDSIHLTLPAPEICHVKIDHSRSKIYNIEYGLWESEKIMDEAYRHAEQQLYIEASKLDLEQKSRENAVSLLKPLLQAMDFKHISISFESARYIKPKN